jgi:type II secretory pathway component PulM
MQVEISPVPLLATALTGAINDATFSDVILVTSDRKEVHAHQFILAARSEYLQVLLSSIPFEQGT